MPISISRPRPTTSFLPQDPGRWALEVAALLGLLLPIMFLVMNWPQIPNIIPTHFGPNGSPDSWGQKSLLIALPITAGGIYLLCTAMIAFPHFLNYPIAVTEQNAQRLYRVAVDMIRWLKFESTWLFGYVTIMTVQVALKRVASLGVWLLPVLLLMVFGTLIISIVRMVRAGQA